VAAEVPADVLAEVLVTRSRVNCSLLKWNELGIRATTEAVRWQASTVAASRKAGVKADVMIKINCSSKCASGIAICTWDSRG